MCAAVGRAAHSHAGRHCHGHEQERGTDDAGGAARVRRAGAVAWHRPHCGAAVDRSRHQLCGTGEAEALHAGCPATCVWPAGLPASSSGWRHGPGHVCCGDVTRHACQDAHGVWRAKPHQLQEHRARAGHHRKHRRAPGPFPRAGAHRAHECAVLCAVLHALHAAERRDRQLTSRRRPAANSDKLCQRRVCRHCGDAADAAERCGAHAHAAGHPWRCQGRCCEHAGACAAQQWAQGTASRCCATRCEAHTADSVGVDAVRGAGAPHVCTVHAGHRSASSRHRAEGSSSSSGAGQPTPMTCDACRHAAQAAVCCTAGRADTHAYAIFATLVAAARPLDNGRKAGLRDFEVMSPGLICA